MPEFGLNTWLLGLMGLALVVMLLMAVSSKRSRLDSRLQHLSDHDRPSPAAFGEFARQTLPTMGKALMPGTEEERALLQNRLINAGLYSRQAMVIYLGVKLLLIVGPAVGGMGLGFLGIIKVQTGLIIGLVCGILGLIGPSFWLDLRKKKRQTAFRRALPDALDVLVICLEGGLSLPGAFRRVAGELRTAHPILASELNIVQREIQLGRTPGEALMHFADRADLEEIRSLALVITQSERFGASLVKAMRVHAETLRTKRLHYAEETAQKAAVKILFPTLIFIFPGLFLVILGPAAIQILEVFSRMRR